MKLIEIYTMMERGDLSEDETARVLNMSVRNLRFRLTKWGHRLPLLLSTLDKIREDKISRVDAAEVLQVTPREINHLMNSWKITRPIKGYLIDRAKADVKWEVRKKFAIDFIAGHLEMDDAAVAADVSPRQMRRWVSDLLMTHFEMPYKDLKQVSNPQRLRLAREIERAEGLEDAKQRVIDAISLARPASTTLPLSVS